MKNGLSFVLASAFSVSTGGCISILQTIHLDEGSPLPHLKLGIFVKNTNYDESIKKVIIPFHRHSN